ncbi:MAG: prolyl oligopeptidase family serine peptidase, partial [Solirubrobacteraceae bacterium]
GEPPADRYAEPRLHPDRSEIWCIRERHGGPRVVRQLVAVPIDGSGVVRELASGSDFLASWRLAPDGSQLAWIAWDHPAMPWDGTTLRVAPIGSDGAVGVPRSVLGGPKESVLQPEWADATTLYAVTDRSGWWNLVRVSSIRADAEPSAPEPLHPCEEEFGAPLWQLGQTTYALLSSGGLAVIHGTDRNRLDVLDPGSGILRRLDLPFTAYQSTLAARGDEVLAIAASPARASALVRIDTTSGRTATVRDAATPAIDPSYLSHPTAEVLRGSGGREVHALVYPPTHPQAVAPAGERPPYIVFAHGGPTAQVTSALDLTKAYFTSRGLGVIDVNYGGSAGFGRAYRQRLRGAWGVVDVEDCVSAVQALAERGAADPRRLAIRGGSAGGWTVLACLTRTAVFAAGTSYYGVSELVAFAAQTHDFESRY